MLRARDIQDTSALAWAVRDKRGILPAHVRLSRGELIRAWETVYDCPFPPTPDIRIVRVRVIEEPPEKRKKKC